MSEETTNSPQRWELFREALTSIGFFSWLLIVFVGGPSALVILETVLDGFRLGDVFQWIVDGWRRVNFLCARLLEPITMPIIDWLRAFGLTVELAPSWTSLFWLLMIPILSLVRALRISKSSMRVGSGAKSDLMLAAIVSFFAVPLLFGCFLAGLVPSQRAWYEPGLVAAFPIVMLGVGLAIVSVCMTMVAPNKKVRILRKAVSDGLGVILWCFKFALMMFAAGVAASLVPGVGVNSGLLVYAIGIMGIGLHILRKSLMDDMDDAVRLDGLRTGASMLGGS